MIKIQFFWFIIKIFIYEWFDCCNNDTDFVPHTEPVILLTELDTRSPCSDCDNDNIGSNSSFLDDLFAVFIRGTSI